MRFSMAKMGTAIEIVSEASASTCEEFHLARDLKIYKDPAVFLGQFEFGLYGL